jgi:hypothetical protein
MMKTNDRQSNTLFGAAGLEDYRFWMAQYYCTHFVHSNYTNLQVFIVFFGIILLPSPLSMAQRPLVGQDLLVIETLLLHSFRYTIIGRNPLDEWSVRRRNLYLTIHNIHKRQTSFCSDRIRNRNPSKRAALDPNFRLCGLLVWRVVFSFCSKYVSASIVSCLVVAVSTTVRVAHFRYNHVTPTPANFEPNLLVTDLKWSAKNRTPISSWIYLLPVYQGALVATRRYLDCSTRSFLKWDRAAALRLGHA